MYRNGKKMFMCQIMAASSQHLCDMFTVSVRLSVEGGQASVLNFEKGGSEK